MNRQPGFRQESGLGRGGSCESSFWFPPGIWRQQLWRLRIVNLVSARILVAAAVAVVNRQHVFRARDLAAAAVAVVNRQPGFRQESVGGSGGGFE